MGIKVTLTIEAPGDKKAVLRLRHKPPEGAEETREVTVGASSIVVSEAYDLVAQTYIAAEVYQITDLVYDREQAAVVEVAPPTEPQKAEAKEEQKESAHRSSGRK